MLKQRVLPPQWSHDLMVYRAKNQCRQEHQMSTVFSMCWFFPPTGCSRADTLLNVHFVLFFTVFSASRQCCPGGGGGGQEQRFLRVMFSAFVHLHWFLQCFSLFRTFFLAPSAFSLGFYSVFRLHDVADATPHIGVEWGGAITFM